MKQKNILTIALLTNCLYAAESPTFDPFTKANELYMSSEWEKASILYNSIHNALIKIEEKTMFSYDDKLDEVDPVALIRGHVNYGDVLFAIAAKKYNNDADVAKQLMLEACYHWSYRLEGRQFGRAPLNNEWDGSDITNKILVVYSERDNGAFGDTFYMTAMLRYAKERGATILFVPQKPLSKLYNKECLAALQTQYVDHVALRDSKLPDHDKAIYLWSILKHYLNDSAIKHPFPIKPCLSGLPTIQTALLEKISELITRYKQEPFLVGMWWRGAGTATAAADWRTLDRDPGAHRMLSVIQDLPVLVINLEGLGRIPLSEEELEKRIASGTAGHSDKIDVTTFPTHNVFNFDSNFDKDIPFGDTLGTMQMIKQKNGILIGCDTGLCNAAAMIEKDEKKYPKASVFAILNKRADFRWSTDTTSPRTWHHSSDVLIFQASEQDKWDAPLMQARKEIEYRIANSQK